VLAALDGVGHRRHHIGQQARQVFPVPAALEAVPAAAASRAAARCALAAVLTARAVSARTRPHGRSAAGNRASGPRSAQQRGLAADLAAQPGPARTGMAAAIRTAIGATGTAIGATGTAIGATGTAIGTPVHAREVTTGHRRYGRGNARPPAGCKAVSRSGILTRADWHVPGRTNQHPVTGCP
jgi:hypothetical protein